MKFKTVTCLTITILGFVSFASANPPQDNNGFVPIFDGKTLDGWHNVPESKAGDWSVIDGKIVGQGSENRLTYLVWKDELTDFELKFRYRMVGKGNTGVEIRAQPDPSGRRPFVGYHADFGHVGIGANVLGAWDFHFAGRREYPCPRGTRLMIDRDGKTKSETIANALTVEDVRKQQWNDVQVIAHGNRFQFFINGKPASEFTDNIEKGRLQKGVIGLQIHDKGMRVEFKDILLKRIPATVDIGTRRELFVDDLLIGKLQGTRLKMHQPQKLRHLPPRPFGHYATVLKDGKKLRLYYRGDKVPGAHWRNGWGKYHEGEVTLYAESTDGGIHWTEPKLNQFKIPEMPKGNVVLAVTDDTFLVTHNFTPFIDTRPGVPKDQRYKALGGGRYPPENWGGWKIKDERKNLRKKYGPGGLKAFASADGLNWKLLKKEPVIQEDLGSFDSQNVAFWSEAEGQYVAYFRFFKNGVRSIRRSTSKDFLHWTEPVDMIANEPGEHLYTSVTQPYFRAPHIYIALPTRFQARAGAITDIVFMATRPGSNKYHRHFKEAFIRPGLGAQCGAYQSDTHEYVHVWWRPLSVALRRFHLHSCRLSTGRISHQTAEVFR